MNATKIALLTMAFSALIASSASAERVTMKRPIEKLVYLDERHQ